MWTEHMAPRCDAIRATTRACQKPGPPPCHAPAASRPAERGRKKVRPSCEGTERSARACRPCLPRRAVYLEQGAHTRPAAIRLAVRVSVRAETERDGARRHDGTRDRGLALVWSPWRTGKQRRLLRGAARVDHQRAGNTDDPNRRQPCRDARDVNHPLVARGAYRSGHASLHPSRPLIARIV